MRTTTILLLLAILLSACSSPKDYEVHYTDSGKEIKIKNITMVYFTEADPALMLKYITDIPMEDIDALRAEAKEIWPTFRVNVENAKVSAGALSAQGPETNVIGSFITTNPSYTFVWVKQEDGKWKLRNDEEKS